MLHPDTELKLVDPEVSYGVFATRPLPAGTITYVRDAPEVTVTPEAYRRCAPELRVAVDRYSYVDERSDRVVSWDFAKYVNHYCRPNSMSTGYGFEATLRDIAAGEQITDEYALFTSRRGCAARVGRTAVGTRSPPTTSSATPGTGTHMWRPCCRGSARSSSRCGRSSTVARARHSRSMPKRWATAR